jgi:hypothetical protein
LAHAYIPVGAMEFHLYVTLPETSIHAAIRLTEEISFPVFMYVIKKYP